MRSSMFAAALLLATSSGLAAAEEMIIYRSPDCGCCAIYVRHVEQEGFRTAVRLSRDVSSVKREQGIPKSLESCHTTLVGGYVVEGHVPVAAIKRLLDERPAIKGIALPGMPAGSPGMPGRKAGPFTIYPVADGSPAVFARE